MTYLAALEYSLAVTLPIFLIVLLGLVLRRLQFIDESFVASASRLVFNVCLPVMIFLAIVQSPVHFADHARLAVFASAAAVLGFVLLWIGSARWVKAPEDRGVAVQSAFRANLAIVGLALCANAYGEAGLALASLILASVTPLYNILSIYALTRSLDGDRPIRWRKLVWDIARNPLIVSIVLALLYAASGLGLPQVFRASGDYLARMTLPLALLTIGGSLSFQALRSASKLSAWVVLIKLVLLPLAVVGAAWGLGIRDIELGSLMLMFACPTAAAAFVMARALGGNYRLASNTIALSTVLSPLTIGAFLYWAAFMGLA